MTLLRRTLPLLLLPASLVLMANDTAVYEYPDGSGVVPLSSEQVRMVEETVRITNPVGRAAHVEATFVFRNDGKREVQVTMGFPFRLQWGQVFFEGDEVEVDIPAALGFESLVDGEPVETRLRTERAGPSGEVVEPTTYQVWDVTFAPGQTRTLVTRYDTQWNHWIDVDDRYGYGLTYITETGAAWAGTIGRATISVEIPAEIPRPSRFEDRATFWEFAPGAVAQTADFSRMSWTFQDWEPRGDVHIYVQGHRYGHYRMWISGELEDRDLDRAWTEQEIEDFARQFPIRRPYAIQVLINTLYARAGHRFSEPEWAGFFAQLDWYRPTRALGLGDLPTDARLTVEAALRVKQRHADLEQRVLDGPYGEFHTEFALRWIHPPSYYLEGGVWQRRFAGSPEREEAWLSLARNALYASHGKTFRDPQLADFFASMPWYRPGDGEVALTEQEQALLALLVAYEQEKGYR